ERGGQNLQRHVATELNVARAINLAHAARADRRDDRIRTEAGPGSYGHTRYNDSTVEALPRQTFEDVPYRYAPCHGSRKRNGLSRPVFLLAGSGVHVNRIRIVFDIPGRFG